ncbi:DUF6185 family protein [Streptomyces cinnamoneus]|uniref:DUF6185 family protein n=1 Tax=Streptomyces cinnamoneus TaxID=53446 RepID=UPI0034194833
MTGGTRTRPPRRAIRAPWGPRRRGGRNAWRRCAAALVLGLLCWGGWPAPADAVGTARAPQGDDCRTAQLAGAHTQVDLRLENHGRSVAEATGLMTVRVPVGWPYADDLLLSESSEPYRRAMRCLLRAPDTMRRPEEWRTHSPRVRAEASFVEVRYETDFRFGFGGHFAVGPWTLDVHSKDWSLQLVAPPALTGARWDRVHVDLGGLGPAEVTPQPSAAENGHLVWTGLHPAAGSGTSPGASTSSGSGTGVGTGATASPGATAPPGTTAGARAGPMVTVRVIPPWQRAWAATSGSSEPWLVANAAGMTTWWVGSSLVIVLAALRARRQPAGPELTEPEKSSSTALWWWGMSKALLGVMVLLLFKATLNIAKAVTSPIPAWLGHTMRWPVLIGVVAGWLLVATARPRRSVLVASSVLAAAAGLVAAVPSLVGLPPQLANASGPSGNAAFAVLVLEAAAMEWLWLAGIVLWGWMLAREGGLLRSSARPWRLRRLGPALAAVVLLLIGWALWSIERKWQRISWLSDRTVVAYHTQHVVALAREVASFASQIPAWYYTHTWILTGLAIVALLRARDLAPATPYASPAPLDRLLLAVFFAIVVAWRQGSYAGSQALAALWLVLGIAALYGLLAVGQRRSVLTQHLQGCNGSPPLCETITEAERSDLIARARRHRELTTALRGIDQSGGEGALQRHAIEKELRRLHRWRPAAGTAAGAARPWLPEQVTVVDVALSWGPHAKWWDNARRAAVLAAAFGLPGSMLMVWMAYSPPAEWMRRGLYMFGVPEMLWMFVYWELVWGGAGLVLGALWRLLPGRRGPARALSLTLAYTLLIGLGMLGSLITDQETGNVAVGISLMLLVLTLTSLAMDADTFRSERRFWPNRIGLLLSIYQIRSFSAQVAYILMQLIAVLTILKFFAGGEARWK